MTDSFEPLHFGTFGALPVKILWCLGDLAPGILAITGYILWWKRKRPLAARDRRRTPRESKNVVPSRGQPG